jgi:hypothetical protein
MYLPYALPNMNARRIFPNVRHIRDDGREARPNKRLSTHVIGLIGA